MKTSFFRGRVRQVHLVGIGGSGMSGIAEVLLNLGFEVSGSDLQSSDCTARLSSLGARVELGHAATHIGGADVVVVSSAVRPDNPEVLAAYEQQVPVIPRAEMLAELMRLKYGIAVAGSHGKTTTTSLVAAVLGQAGIDPTVVIGGRVNALGSNARLGQGPYLVAEADESDGSFLNLSPTIAVITNLDPEHLDHWTGGLPQLQQAFIEFANKVPFYGLVVLCHDHPNVKAILPAVTRRFVTYGLSPQADYRATELQRDGWKVRFTVVRRGDPMGEIELPMVGQHNVVNSLAAIAVGDELGARFEDLRGGLAAFAGIERRFQIVVENDDLTIVDDYGHHPAEIRAVLAAAREVFDRRRFVVAFQPHRYTRTRDLLDEFTTCFDLAETLLVTDIYAASEEPISGVSGAALAAAVRDHGHRDARYVPQDQLVEVLWEGRRSGDIVFTLGAGNVWRAGTALRDLLQEDQADASAPGEGA